MTSRLGSRRRLRGGPGRVWSLCPMLNEVDLLEVRLRELEDVVDVFVISESPRTYAGADKPLHFAEHRDRFEPWLDRIRYVVTTRLESATLQRTGDKRRWQRENGQRAAMSDALHDLEPHDVVVISDLDEIPRAETIRWYVKGGFQSLIAPPLPMYLYSARWRSPARHASLLRLGRGLLLEGRTPEDVRRMPTRPPTVGVIADGDPASRWGWHMSYFGGIDAIRYKVAQAAHPEEDIAGWLEPDVLERCIREGVDHRQNRPHRQLEAAPLASLPLAIRRDPERFRTLLDPLEWPADYDGGQGLTGVKPNESPPSPVRQRRRAS